MLKNINVIIDPYFFSEVDSDRYMQILDDNLIFLSDEETQVKIGGKYTSIPRKQVAYSEPNLSYHFAGANIKTIDWNNGDLVSIILKEICAKVNKKTGCYFNFCLINKYRDGNDYIGPHRDDENDLTSSTIAGVSFGAERKIRFTKVDNDDQYDKLLNHGSLYVMYPPTNQYWKHAIPKQHNIKKSRISLTFRCMKI